MVNTKITFQMILHRGILLFLLTGCSGEPNPLHNPLPEQILPYRPMASNRISTIQFSTKILTLKKTYDLSSHIKYFNDIIFLWSSIFLENQLTGAEDMTLHPTIIDNTNPECRDLRSIILDSIKSVSDTLDKNFISHQISPQNLRFKRSSDKIRDKKILYQASSTIILKRKRSFLASSVLKMMSTYVASKGISYLTSSDTNLGDTSSLFPLGGTLLSFAFGTASKESVVRNRKMINILTNQFINLEKNQKSLIKFANITKLILDEMAEVISTNDKRILLLFNISSENEKINRRSKLCFQLYAESAYLIQSIKTTISNFIMADTLVPKGNKNLFSEAELNNILLHIPEHRIASGNRNLWDYSLFRLHKNDSEWTYEIQIPLTNLPTFSIYKLSPFPVFPEPYSKPALIVDLNPETTITLSSDD